MSLPIPPKSRSDNWIQLKASWFEVGGNLKGVKKAPEFGNNRINRERECAAVPKRPLKSYRIFLSLTASDSKESIKTWTISSNAVANWKAPFRIFYCDSQNTIQSNPFFVIRVTKSTPRGSESKDIQNLTSILTVKPPLTVYVYVNRWG